jgi:uncharacterized protein (DUF433 family)
MEAMDYRQYITINPEVRSGKPCVKGTRITVGDVLGYFASGMSEKQVLDDFPELSHDSILACFAYAAAAQEGTQSVVV